MLRNATSLQSVLAMAALTGLAVLVTVASPPQPIAAAITEAPRLATPADKAVLTNFGPVLTWTNPPGTTQYQLQVIPAQNDGPGVNLILGDAGVTFTIPAPPNWYGLLPGMSYTWRVRTTDAAVSVPEGDSSWGPWSEAWSFTTPAASSSSINPASPASGTPVTTLTPVLAWTEANGGIFYYEVQVSKDPRFGPNTSLYWALLHGGVTNPRNSYRVPPEFPLENNATYYWRVRPRVQGDGTPVEWSLANTFRTGTSAQPPSSALFLQVTAPADESTTKTASIQVTGKTSLAAIVTVNEVLATVQADGTFTATLTLTEGPNIIDIIASSPSGDTQTVTLTIDYVP